MAFNLDSSQDRSIGGRAGGPLQDEDVSSTQMDGEFEEGMRNLVVGKNLELTFSSELPFPFADSDPSSLLSNSTQPYDGFVVVNPPALQDTEDSSFEKLFDFEDLNYLDEEHHNDRLEADRPRYEVDFEIENEHVNGSSIQSTNFNQDPKILDSQDAALGVEGKARLRHDGLGTCDILSITSSLKTTLPPISAFTVAQQPTSTIVENNEIYQAPGYGRNIHQTTPSIEGLNNVLLGVNRGTIAYSTPQDGSKLAEQHAIASSSSYPTDKPTYFETILNDSLTSQAGPAGYIQNWNIPTQQNISEDMTYSSQIPLPPEELDIQDEGTIESLMSSPVRRRGRPRKEIENPRIHFNANHDNEDNLNVANRAPRSRAPVRASDPHVRLPPNHVCPHEPYKIASGMNSGRNLLAVFGRDTEPKLRMTLVVDRGRKGKDANPDYPLSTEPIPAKTSLAGVCKHYPNHVWGTMLRVFLCEGWEAEKIWSNLPENCRHDTSKVRSWNYLQQAIGREVDKMMEEETGQKRVPEKRKKDDFEITGEDRGPYQPPKKVRTIESNHSFVLGDGRQYGETYNPVDLKNSITLTEPCVMGARPSAMSTANMSGSTSAHAPTQFLFRHNAPTSVSGSMMANQGPNFAEDLFAGWTASRIKVSCDQERARQATLLKELCNARNPHFEVIETSEKRRILKCEFDRCLQPYLSKLRQKFNEIYPGNEVDINNPIEMAIEIIRHQRPPPQGNPEAEQQWREGIMHQAWRNYFVALRQCTRAWYRELQHIQQSQPRFTERHFAQQPHAQPVFPTSNNWTPTSAADHNSPAESGYGAIHNTARGFAAANPRSNEWLLTQEFTPLPQFQDQRKAPVPHAHIPNVKREYQPGIFGSAITRQPQPVPQFRLPSFQLSDIPLPAIEPPRLPQLPPGSIFNHLPETSGPCLDPEKNHWSVETADLPNQSNVTGSPAGPVSHVSAPPAGQEQNALSEEDVVSEFSPKSMMSSATSASGATSQEHKSCTNSAKQSSTPKRKPRTSKSIPSPESPSKVLERERAKALQREQLELQRKFDKTERRVDIDFYKSQYRGFYNLPETYEVSDQQVVKWKNEQLPGMKDTWWENAKERRKRLKREATEKRRAAAEGA